MKSPRSGAWILALVSAWMLLAAVGAPLSSSSVASIQGQVAVPDVPRPRARRPTVRALGMPLRREGPDRRRSVVYLETAPNNPSTSASGAKQRAAIDQRDETFVPHVLAVSTGTTVDFPNSDEIYHNVFSLSQVRSFDLGRYAAGKSKAVVFDRPGVVRVFCDIHSHMSAFVLVFPHEFFAVTDEDGRYAINGVPPGRYTLVAWNESVAPETRAVEIGNAGGLIDVDFVLQER